jgi:membrane-bound lytic murein transglycosylase D
MKRLIALTVFTLALSACATAPSAKPRLSPAAARPQAQRNTDVVSVAELKDAAELQAALAEAYKQIEARATTAPSQVDADAALSMDIPDHRTVRGAIQYFSTDLHDKIQESLYRSARFKSLIDNVLDEYGLPRAFAYLPVIESAYIPTLTSRAGAHGIWQFMPPTAREMGLRVDWWVDERANPEKSTRAAAQYLRQLYQQFGDWSLVLAAYNAGPGRVKRAMEATGATTFWELLEQNALPKETRGYVPTFFATITIASDPQTYGFELKKPDEHKEKLVSVAGPLSFEFLAAVTDVDRDVLREMNPEFRRGILPPGRTQLRVPEAAARLVAERADSLRYEDPYIAVTSFTLRDGDNVDKLARLCGASREEIERMNDIDASHISAGDSIYLPVKKTVLSTLLAGQNRPADEYYEVSQGDTLYSIARRHGLSVEELLDLNRMGGDSTIHPGQRLRVTLGATMTGGM